MSNEKTPGCFGFIGDDILPIHVEIINKPLLNIMNKDPYIYNPFKQPVW